MISAAGKQKRLPAPIQGYRKTIVFHIVNTHALRRRGCKQDESSIGQTGRKIDIPRQPPPFPTKGNFLFRRNFDALLYLFRNRFFLEASITISLFLGLTSTCVEVLEGFSVRSSSTFGFILHGPLALITGLICLAVVALGFVLLLVPGVYLGAILAFASFLVLERNLYPLRAIRTSAALTHRHWKTVIPLIWLSAFVICGGFVPFVLVRIFFDLNQWWVYFLVIPIFWTLPFGFFLFGESYRRIAAEGV